MTTPSRWRIVPALVGTTILFGLLAWTSAVPLPFHRSEEARLRLSWTARPDRLEECRILSPAELAKAPEHMRRRVECEGRFASYDLRVEVDGRLAGEAVVRGGGLRHDRPIHVLRELSVTPGTRRIRLSFVRRESVELSTGVDSVIAEADTGLFAGRAERELAERARRRQAAIPPRLELDTTVTIGRRAVALITWDAERKTFELRTAQDRPSPASGSPADHRF
ncbi:MAG: hypothetical protein R2909_03190 [Gemmatimonadales bacterium]